MKIEKWDDVHGNTTSDDRMVAFLESSTDSYAILQLKHIPFSLLVLRQSRVQKRIFCNVLPLFRLIESTSQNLVDVMNG